MAAPLVLLAQALTSCGSDDDGDTACEPNSPRACAGPNNCEGNQTCFADGSGYSPCACDGAGAGGNAGVGGSANAGNGGSANAGAAGAGAGDGPIFNPNVGAIGSACASDADCPVGPGGETPLTCVTQGSTAFAGGGPQGGYCSLPCTDSDQCAAVDGPSVCGLQDATTGSGYCFRLCEPGAGGVKCPQLEQACLPGPAEVGNIGICTPVCTSDFACGDGQFCNLAPEGIAVCSGTAPTGTGELGAACTEATAATDCKSGLCVSPGGDPAQAFCTTFCTLGLSEGCGFAADSGQPRDAVCALAPSQTADLGDLGLCVELCDTADDCEQDGWVCEALPDDVATDFGRVGSCIAPGEAAPDAGAP